MFVIIGIVVVLGCVIGGFLLEGGHMGVLIQPIELLIIGGAALGSFIISAPKSVVIGTFKHIMHVFTGKEASASDYQDLLTLLFELLNIARRDGIVALEPHVAKPEQSSTINRYPNIAKNKQLAYFICDNIKCLLSEGIDAHRYDDLMRTDIATMHHHAMIAPTAVTKVADSLPGLGIVAAVLGIVLTMGKINEPPEVLGHSIGAALVGTFLGILMCYGFVGPMATNLEYQAKAQQHMLHVAKEVLGAFNSGFSPMLSVEMGRRAIPDDVRPTMEDMEGALRGKK
ncbi:flagellar motor stator protein MotA [Solidesulfovibrio alcoholivorans]|uniref:flagellar motor stator protein MotA n=1 Tax=Solidesulfovibrio alcoholivorans TaxID=81406 RepID=UPI000497973D|nr:flagellar motor stator protein MotA [Solidesulfovibrio alcoholivorans]